MKKRWFIRPSPLYKLIDLIRIVQWNSVESKIKNQYTFLRARIRLRERIRVKERSTTSIGEAIRVRPKPYFRRKKQKDTSFAPASRVSTFLYIAKRIRLLSTTRRSLSDSFSVGFLIRFSIAYTHAVRFLRGKR